MKGSVKLPVFIDDARKLVNTTQLRAKYLGASYEAEYCQWQTLHGLGSLMETASLIITPNAYLEGKLLASYPPDPIGDFDVTRATTATRVNSQGLVELVPYNLLSYSEDLSNSAWLKGSVSITSNSTTAPNGTTTADTVTDTASTGYLFQDISVSGAGQIVTISVYAKKTNTDWLNFSVPRSGATTSGEFRVWFNISNGTVGTTQNVGAGVVLDTNIESVGDGWYRCSVTGYVSDAMAYTLYLINTNADNTYSSTVGNSRYQWGIQAVEGSVAKDYQKTETRLNIPRLDYSNGTCPSILVEPQRTNLITYSSSFDNAAWIKNETSVTSNATISPSGVQDADKIIPSTNNSSHNVDRFGLTVSNNGFGSVYAKAAEFSRISLYSYFTNSYTTFDLSNGTILAQVSSVANIEDAGNGWYRCSIYDSGNSMYGYVIAVLNNSNTNPFTAYTGDGTSGVFLWGAQLEVGSYATSYIPTTSASVTRNADVISKTGISSLIGQTEGTLFWDVDFQVVANNDAIFIKDNASFDTFVFMQKESSGIIACGYYGSGALQARIESSAVPTGRYKIAFAYKNNDFVMYLNGTQVGTDTSGTVSGLMDYFDLHWTESGCNNAYATALWKTRLTNTQLAQLTTI